MTERGWRPEQVEGLAYQLPNLLANGDFEIWQRGVGPFTGEQIFTADEWYLDTASAGDARSISRGTPPKVGAYCLSVDSWARTLTHGLHIKQAVEAYKQLEGQWLTFSAWVFSPYRDSVRIRIAEYLAGVGGRQTESPDHSGTNRWERLTVCHQLRSGLIPYVDNNWPHASPVFVALDIDTAVLSGSPVLIDGATLVVGRFPEGVPFAPTPPAEDQARCERFFQNIPYMYNRGYEAGADRDNYYQESLPTTMAASPVVSVGSWTLGNAKNQTITVQGGLTLRHYMETVAAGDLYAYANDIDLEVA